MKGATVTKDTVKQDLERSAELQRSTLRAIAALYKSVPAGTNAQFDLLVANVRDSPQWGVEFKELTSAPWTGAA